MSARGRFDIVFSPPQARRTIDEAVSAFAAKANLTVSEFPSALHSSGVDLYKSGVYLRLRQSVTPVLTIELPDTEEVSHMALHTNSLDGWATPDHVNNYAQLFGYEMARRMQDPPEE
jgi:hypothetical protein